MLLLGQNWMLNFAACVVFRGRSGRRREERRSRGEKEPSHAIHVAKQCSKVVLPNLSPSWGGVLCV